MRKKGFTLIELLVVIAIIAMLLAILMPALNKVKKIAMRVVCATNLKGMGTAQMVYANDYNDDYTVQGGGGAHTWADRTARWDDPTKNWADPTQKGNITVGASLFLLVREADVSPKSFICPSGEEKEFSGVNINTNNPELIELWDFGHKNQADLEGPVKCVSYSYHMPYAAGQTTMTSTGSRGTYAASGTQSASFAMMADKNPFLDDKLINGGSTIDNWIGVAQRIGGSQGGNWEALEKWKVQRANAQSHGREGQNVLFGDGHATYEKRADVGVQNDNIYLRWQNKPPTEEDRRKGFNPASMLTDFAPAGSDDSVLVNDALNMAMK